jgi:isopentenyl diphosphate isomerase/L-lactate dehydrogenase-like FMN-dependent dehydrogenase
MKRSAARNAAKILTLEDARKRAERILPRVLFDFVDGGAGDEITLRENRRVYDDVSFRNRVAAVPLEVDLSAKVLGAELSLPVILAPVGPIRLVYPDGDRATMRAAGAAGTAAILSTAAGTPLDDVIAATTGPAWFQLYFRGGRAGAEEMVESAQRAGYGALFVTLDVVGGTMQTERIRHQVDKLARLRGETGLDSAIPLGLNVRNAVVFAPELVRHLRWTMGYVGDGVPTKFASADPKYLEEPAKGSKPAYNSVTWADMDWIREVWKGPLVAKGVLTGEDARRAVDHGVDGILVSNHGGRYLDGVTSTLKALPEVRSAVGDSIQVLVDGGIRRGSDVVKAIALGADAAVIGRAYAYGLAAAGEAGVKRVIEIFRREMTWAMKSLGRVSLAEIDETAIDASKLFPARSHTD